MRPVRRSCPLSCTRASKPAEATSCSAVGNRVISPMAAKIVTAETNWMPGNWMSKGMRGALLATAASASSSWATCASANAKVARSDWMRVCSNADTGNCCHQACWAGANRFPGGGTIRARWSAAWRRFRAWVVRRRSFCRCTTSVRRSRTAGGGTQIPFNNPGP